MKMVKVRHRSSKIKDQCRQNVTLLRCSCCEAVWKDMMCQTCTVCIPRVTLIPGWMGVESERDPGPLAFFPSPTYFLMPHYISLGILFGLASLSLPLQSPNILLCFKLIHGAHCTQSSTHIWWVKYNTYTFERCTMDWRGETVNNSHPKTLYIVK